jgi:hypothetical protein
MLTRFKIVYLPTAAMVRWNNGKSDSRIVQFIQKENAVAFLETEEYYMIGDISQNPFVLDDCSQWKKQYLKDYHKVPKYLLEVVEVG